MRFIDFDIDYIKEGYFEMDITILFKMAGIGIIITVICQILKKSDKDEIATLVTLASLVIVLTMVVSMIGELLDTVKTLFSLY